MAGIGVSASIAGAIKAVKDFGKTAEDLKFTSLESGFSTKKIESLTSGMEAFGDSVEAAHAKQVHLGQELNQFRQHHKSMFDEIIIKNPLIAPQLEDLRNSKSADEALQKLSELRDSQHHLSVTSSCNI